MFSLPEMFAPGTLCLIFSTASWARVASRDPTITVSPAWAQRRARPNPSGPVPPRIAMGRGVLMRLPSCDSLCVLGFQRLFRSQCIGLQLEIDSRVDGVAFCGDASGFQNERLKILGTGVLASGGSDRGIRCWKSKVF